MHAEQNALLQAARLGYTSDGADCYTTLRPCFGCLKELHQGGIASVRYLNAWAPGPEPLREAYDGAARRSSTRAACAVASSRSTRRCSTCAERSDACGRRVSSSRCAIGMTVIAAAAAHAHHWVVAITGGVFALWLGSLAVRGASVAENLDVTKRVVMTNQFTVTCCAFAHVSGYSDG